MSGEVDKSGWGDGPWQTEPDELVWSFGDVECRIVRQPHNGALNGYVGLPPSHPWHGRDWATSLDEVDVHGGLSFYGQFAAHTFATPTSPQVWYIGFDCAHAWDLSPGMNARYRARGAFDCINQDETYRSIEYVKAETEGLARQAIAAMRVGPSKGTEKP